MPHARSGYFRGGLPCNRFGHGQRVVVVFPGLEFENKPVTGPRVLGTALQYQFLSAAYTTYVLAGVWRPLALVAASVSLAGIALFVGNWPAFNTVAALAVDVVVIVSLLWLRWPPREIVGS